MKLFFKIYYSMVLLIKIIFFLILMYLNLPSFSLAQNNEYILKAAFMERFTRFIDWPNETGINDTTKPFIIGVIGENPFGSILDNLAMIQKIKSKRIEIRYYTIQNLNPDCHLLFISDSESENLKRILSVTKKKPILTIGDKENFCRFGVLINFLFEKNKLLYEVNETALNQAGLVVSYLLLMTAKKVHSGRSINQIYNLESGYEKPN
jgi:hypothetical protein